MTLVAEFQRAMLAIYERNKEYEYNATYFKRMLDQYGGLQAAKRLLVGHDIQSGLMALWELGKLDDSMEVLVLEDRFRPLFTGDEIAEAHRRLEALEYFSGATNRVPG